jgi:hypothetical protein
MDKKAKKSHDFSYGAHGGLLAGSQDDGHLDFAAFADYGQHDLLSGPLAIDDREQVVRQPHSFSVDGDDQIGRAAVDLSLFVDERPAALLLANQSKALQSGTFSRSAGGQVATTSPCST